MMRRFVLICLCVLGVAGPAAPQGPRDLQGGPTQKSQSGSVSAASVATLDRMSLRMQSPPQVGDNVLVVEGVEAAPTVRLRAALTLAGRPDGVVPRVLRADGAGRWTLPVRFDRPGDWIAVVDVERGAERLARQSLSIAVVPVADSAWRGKVATLALAAGLLAALRRRLGLAVALAGVAGMLLVPRSTGEAGGAAPPRPLPVVVEQPLRAPMFSRLTAAATVVPVRAQVVLADATSLLLAWDAPVGAVLRAGQAVARTPAGTVRAPRDGVVTRRLAEVGTTLRAGQTPLYELARADEVGLEARVPRADMSAIEVGTSVDIPRSSMPAIRGIVDEISPLVEDGQTVRILARVDNPTMALRLGETVTLQVLSGTRLGTLSVPAAAVTEVGTQAWVWTAEDVAGQPVARHRPVEIGLREGDRVEVRRGLTAGDRVVVAGDVVEDDTLVTLVAATSPPARAMREMP